ncbi:SIR2 family protein [Methanoculleus sp.]|uniref:SIR2 family protein n=1 Tax=Methanoculleus sp. TaxID=90427 RepID=UPI001BD588E3|nr:SIR2 family protein [Methanoculleus sp.]
MNTDAVVPVAYAMHASPKRYALLLGSGISVAAGLPTATDVSGNMILAVAEGRGEKVERGENNEVCLAWFEEAFGVPATFQRLMTELGISEENRKDGLKKFIYRTDENGDPVPGAPTEAHRAIARLVKSGTNSLIITTNFDTLMEEGLKAETVPYEVITEESDVRQMSVFPDRCRVLKVNGDFERGTLRITPEDLRHYPPAMEDYLRRIFGEYGLVTCGWSGIFDTHLVEILCAADIPRRYPVFCCRRGGSDPSEVCRPLLPNGIDIDDADEFFTTLEAVIERFSRFEPKTTLTAAAAVRKVKEAMMGSSPELIVPDVINEEVEKVLIEIENERYILPGTIEAQTVYYRRLAEIEGAATPLAAMLATLAYYDKNGDYCTLIADTIERLINPKYIEPFMDEVSTEIIAHPSRNLSSGLKNLRYYPALLAVYAAGIAAVKEDRLTALDAIITKPQLFRYNGIYQQKTEFFDRVNIWNILGCDHHWIIELGRETFGSAENFYTYPFLTVQRVIRPLIPNEKRYAEYFDIFEYLYCLAFLDSHRENWEAFQKISHKSNFWIRFVLTTCGYDLYCAPTIPSHVIDYLASFSWKMERTTFFNGERDRFEWANNKFAECFRIQAPEVGVPRVAVRAYRRPGT